MFSRDESRALRNGFAEEERGRERGLGGLWEQNQSSNLQTILKEHEDGRRAEISF